MAYGRVLIDMCTQRDFLAESAAMPVVDRETVLRHVRRAFAWARHRRVPIVSALEAHRPNEGTNGHPACCVDGTDGQRKVPFTLLPNRVALEVDNSLAVPLNLLRQYRQVVLRKRSYDFLGNPKAERLLSETRVGEYVVLGVAMEQCVKSLVLGLLARQKRVLVVRDACGFWDQNAADLATRQMEAKGARIIDSSELQSLQPIRMRRPSWMAFRAASGGNGNGNGNGNGRHGNIMIDDETPEVPARTVARKTDPA